jgi:hypothetical protein
MDVAYSTVGKSAKDFHTTYTFVAGQVPAGFTFDLASMNSTVQEDRRKVTIANTVMPGVYTLTGQYKSSVAADPVVNISIKVTVTGNMIDGLKKDLPFWSSDQTYGIINGRDEGPMGWKLNANLWDYWTVVTNGGGANKPVTTFVYSINPVGNPGISIALGDNPTLAEVQLNDAISQARDRVNNGHVVLTVSTFVNGAAYKTENFMVQFRNRECCL